MRGAGGQPLCDQLERVRCRPENLVEATQLQPVDDLLSATLGLDETAVAQGSQVGADPGLRLIDQGAQHSEEPGCSRRLDSGKDAIEWVTGALRDSLLLGCFRSRNESLPLATLRPPDVLGHCV